jgi:putative endonuclease
MQKNHKAIGLEGEIEALEFLTGQRYSLRHQNYRTRKGEVDLIMDDPDGTLVFVEVKSDVSGNAGAPESWVTPKKIRQIQRTAQAYCAEFGLDGQDMRFDVVSICFSGYNKNIRHIKNAFLPNANNYY